MLDKNEKIAIWGTGLFAKKFYQMEYKNYDIVCFYDNDSEMWNKELYGIPVKKWDNNREIKIVIASSYWREILTQIQNYDLQLLDDVIPYLFVHCRSLEYRVLQAISNKGEFVSLLRQLKGHRKIAVIHGNCQINILRELLLLIPSFSKEYFFIEIPAVFDYNASEEKRELWNTLLAHDEFWKQIDLFLCQKVNQTNRFCPALASDHLVRKLSPNCQVIMLINIYFDGYFPQQIRNQSSIMKEIHQSGLFPHGDVFIDELIKKGFSEKDILDLIEDESFITPKIVEMAANQSLTELKEREKEVDVRISDYIELGYKKKQLFYSPNHPANTVLIEYARRIIRYMGLTDCEINEDIAYIEAGCLKGQDTPVYPSVIKVLNIKKYDQVYYPNRYLESNFLVDFEDYIKNYIDYCHR